MTAFDGDPEDINKFTAEDIMDAWNSLFPGNDGHDVALLVSWLMEYR